VLKIRFYLVFGINGNYLYGIFLWRWISIQINFSFLVLFLRPWGNIPHDPGFHHFSVKGILVLFARRWIIVLGFFMISRRLRVFKLKVNFNCFFSWDWSCQGKHHSAAISLLHYKFYCHLTSSVGLFEIVPQSPQLTGSSSLSTYWLNWGNDQSLDFTSSQNWTQLFPFYLDGHISSVNPFRGGIESCWS
jgi:hypothetical protein